MPTPKRQRPTKQSERRPASVPSGDAADLARLEELLAQILAALRQPQTQITVGNIIGSSGIAIGTGASALTVPEADIAALGALATTGDARFKEEVNLIRFVLGETYARWDRYYVPLAGQLQPAPLRLHDHTDPNFGAGGLPLDDVRDAIRQHHKTRLVLLGEPGAGKTTTLYRLALDLVRERLRDPTQGKLPVSLNLANFRSANQLPADFLRAHWDATGLGLSYGEAVAARQVCFLLDGLNQMPADDRSQRIEAWRNWATSDADLPTGNVAVFTCRTADYVARLNLPEVHVQALDNDRIHNYFNLRFGPEHGGHLWRELRDRLRTGDKRFEDLARNPMLLSLLADGAEAGQSLGETKGGILREAANRRLKYELESGNQPQALTADPEASFNAELDALCRIAFEMQAQGEGTVFDRAKLEAVPLTGKGQLTLTLDEVLDLAIDATLMKASDDDAPRFEFCHQLFQEYFAARELLRRFRRGERLSKYWNVGWWQYDLRLGLGRPRERLETPPVTGWEETVMMAGGLAGKDTARLVAAIRAGNLPLAGRTLAEARPEAREDLNTLADDLRAALLNRQRSQHGLTRAAHLRARIAAGLALGELGHPDLRPRQFEFEGRTVWAVAPPMEPVAAGEFIRGSATDDKSAYGDERTTERSVSLSAYSIGRYPVTSAEYRFFIEDGGYENMRWWSDAGLKWKAGGADAHAAAIDDWMGFRTWAQEQKDVEAVLLRQGRTRANARYWKEVSQLSEEEARERARQSLSRAFDRPAFWEDTTLNSPARPVVGVNWHEAEAYARWLSAVTGNDYRLPSEMEWEKAARGNEGRVYPWGDEFDSARCNTNESRILTTTPVGLYPNGRSPFGLYDASGNVWEWTADWYQAYPGGPASDDYGERFKAVRGGSWLYDRRNARCAYRFRYVPVDFLNLVGFRLFSPVSAISAF